MDKLRNPNQQLQSARAAFGAGEWAEARRLLEALDAGAEELGADDLEMLGYASILDVGAGSIAQLERAAEALEADGREHDAARVALDVARFAGGRGQMPVAMAWCRRAQRMLEGKPDGAGHAHLVAFNAFMAQARGRLSEALQLSEQAHALARKHGDVDAEGLALNRRGRLLVRLGRMEEGKADLDEAMLLVCRSAMRPIPASLVYCSTIDACSDMADYPRAMQWTEAASAWIEKRRVCAFPGLCRVHRAELMRLRGDHEGAEREAQEAIAVFERFDFGLNIAYAQGERGLQLLEVGDLDGAETAFAAAHELGHEPLPGLAIMALRRGDPSRGRALLEPALQECGEDRLKRARLLPTLVEICLELGDGPAARAASDELSQTAEAFGTVGLRASASTAAARVHISEHNAGAAVMSARAATREWVLVGAAYELARARELLTTAYTMADNAARGQVEQDVVQARARERASADELHAAHVATQAARDPDGIPPPLASDPRIREGMIIDDKIDVGRPLGAGAMGVVYAGRHRITGRDVAIKVLQRGLSGDERQYARFLQEAQACGRIRHLNVVDVYDAGEHHDEPYIVMELLDGEPLSDRLCRAPSLEVEEALAVANQAARGVAAAHTAGVIHRDLKPDNMFLCRGDSNSLVVKVLDFGISKLPDANRTRAGAILGTPLYMAPEQVRDSSTVDERTDVHALGAVLFEMLAGRPPYVAKGATAVLLAIADGPPAELTAHRSDLQPAIVELVHRAIARDPADRFASADELANALEDAQQLASSA